MVTPVRGDRVGGSTGTDLIYIYYFTSLNLIFLPYKTDLYYQEKVARLLQSGVLVQLVGGESGGVNRLPLQTLLKSLL